MSDKNTGKGDRDADARLRAAFMLAVDLAPDTLRKYGVDAQRAKAIEEADELIEALRADRGQYDNGHGEADTTIAHEYAIIDECADVLIMAISCASTNGALNWREQLADRIAFKVARTRTRMGQVPCHCPKCPTLIPEGLHSGLCTTCELCECAHP